MDCKIDYEKQVKYNFDLRQEIFEIKLSKFHVVDCEKCNHKAVCNMLGGYEELKKRFINLSFRGMQSDTLDNAQLAMINGRCIYFGGANNA